MLPIAKEFFKRNPKAKAAHVVLDRVYDNMDGAKSFRKFTNATITSYTRDEYKAALKIEGSLQTPIDNNLQSTENK